jgi:hypothetical protein
MCAVTSKQEPGRGSFIVAALHALPAALNRHLRTELLLDRWSSALDTDWTVNLQVSARYYVR